MSTYAPFQIQVACIMEALTKTAVAEITKLVDTGSAALRLEVCRSQRENEELKKKLLLMEGELRAVRGYGEGAPGNSINLSFDVKVCDDISQAYGPMVAEEGSISATESSMNEGLRAHLTRDDRNLPAEKAATPYAFDMKHEPIDGEQDGIGEGPLCKEEELHMQPCPAGNPEKGLQAELKQEPEEQPLTPTPPQLESADSGMELECVWSEANSSGITLQQNRKCGGSSEHRDSWLADYFPPPHYRASERPFMEEDEGPASHLKRKQNGRPLTVADDISAEMAFPLGSTRECGGSAQEKEFICTRWGKMFPEALELKAHKEQHSPWKQFSCSVSSKDFTSTRILEKHEQVHNREKPLTRSECDKRFSRSHDLQEQKRTRTGQKPYVCAVCGKCFHLKKSLRAHQSIHTGDKFPCTQCGKRFNLKCNLMRHQRVHTGEKPYRCNECGKSFAQQSVLKDHQFTHTGERPFSCEHCGKSFNNRGNHKTHQRVHTGEKPHRCNECGKSFAKRCHLKRHQTVHNRGETIPLHTVQQVFFPESVQHVALFQETGSM